MAKKPGINTGVPEIDVAIRRILTHNGVSRMDVSKDYIGKKLRDALLQHEFITYAELQGDFQYYSVAASLRQGDGWGIGGHNGRAYCFTMEKRFEAGTVQGYVASMDLELMSKELIRATADGWSILRKSWENSDKS